MNLGKRHIFLARQAAKGQHAAEAKFRIPLTGGNGGSIEKSHEEYLETVKPGALVGVSEIKPTTNFNCFAYKELLPELLAGIMGQRVSSGSTAPFTHIISIADDTAYYTIWVVDDDDAGGYTYDKYTDVVLSKVNLTAEKGPAAIEVEGSALDVTSNVAVPVLANDGIDLTEESGHGIFRVANGTIKFKAADDTPVLISTGVKAGLELTRELATQTQFGKGTPAYVEAKRLQANPSLTLRGTKADLRTLINGSPTASKPSPEPIYSSCEIMLPADDDSDHLLTLLAVNIVFKPGDSEASPERETYEMELSTDTTSAIPTATIINATAASVYAVA
jgi:hypothetical protein